MLQEKEAAGCTETHPKPKNSDSFSLFWRFFFLQRWMTIDRKDHLLCELPCLCGMLNGNLSGKMFLETIPGTWTRIYFPYTCDCVGESGFFGFFLKKRKPLLSLHDSSHGKKDTASKLQSESQWPRFSVRGQKPLRMVDMESHDAQSAGKKEEAEFTLDLKPAIRSSPTQSS